MKKNRKTMILGGVGAVALVVALGLMIVGMSKTVEEIGTAVVSHTPEAILASAGVSEETRVSLPVAYYDQRADECVNIYDDTQKMALSSRQFEWSECGYHNKLLEQGLVDFELGENYLPVALGGELVPNRGVNGDNFARWFNKVEGKSESYEGTLQMDYKTSGAEFSFHKEEFYPLDSVAFSDGDAVNIDGHNHLFTMNFAVPFTVLADGNEYFEITADDDTFVFVNNKLAVDMGGVHDAMVGRFAVNQDGEVYSAVGKEELAFSGVAVGEGESAIVRIFHADRDASESVFKVLFRGMNLTVMNTTLANNDGGVQIAYDPTDPSYVAPLGETSVFRPDNTKGLIIMATIEGVALVVIAFMVAGVVRFMLRAKARK